jgi:hypothetical protein
MAKEPTPKEGDLPEALETFEAAARSGGVKPPEQGLDATPETEPKPDSLEREVKAAKDVLKAGVEHDPKAMTEVVQKSKDPRIP